MKLILDTQYLNNCLPLIDTVIEYLATSVTEQQIATIKKISLPCKIGLCSRTNTAKTGN